MGSVPHLYTTGDNDPEIEPVQYYRHYLYCDQCGSFDLTSWDRADTAVPVPEATRKKLAAAALYVSPLIAVPIWQWLGFVLSPSMLIAPIAGIGLVLVFWAFSWQFIGTPESPLSARWHFLKKTLLILLSVGAVELLTEDLPGWPFLIVGFLLVVVLLASRQEARPKSQLLGMRCEKCDATYAYGSRFFTNLEANPNGLTLGDVPRPLGVSHFEEGKFVGPAPPEQGGWNRQT
jgi:hypothetical protein